MILGLGEYVRVGYPEVWEGMEWSEVFPTVEINVVTNVEIQEAAMTLKPVTIPSQRTK